jgi:hypothetical protein
MKAETATSAFNRNQKELQSLFKGGPWARIKELILEQNAIVHGSRASGDPTKKGEDELWAAGDLDRLRVCSPKDPYSGAWHLWHSARIEDICSHYLIAGTEQVFTRKDRGEKMKCGFVTTGNELDEAGMKRFNGGIDLKELRSYRIEVGKETRRIVERMDAAALGAKVDADALARIRDDGNIGEGAEWLLDFWGRKRIWGIVAMPLTRHLMVHLNEARLKAGLKR